ncbi:DegT/DnrJ/EryC1/StrS family aminotransferase [Halegenticoccus tardaugens]|uniref:DegT/DnrJ/EryC1/StrS family aminotransferase n=1 Tax=Halegenticoccus tardaugens TaxID=2071624 RepID=UPI00100A9ABA|nr:DegT/DnrJ/EryC1/StrS family aminotransferase [Halegenticoccus tardaugens]
MSVPIAAPDIGDAELKGVVDVLESGMLADGDVVRTFEERFADYCGTDYAVATSNGTTALHAALVAAGVGEDDTVVTAPFSFVATANAILFSGATPAFADVNPETYNLDPSAVEETIRARDGDVDAIMPVHLYGLPAEMDRLREIADEHDTVLIEDAAQAHGATHRGRPAGSLGNAACFSFYPTKNMTTGEGGMITTDDEEIAAAAARFVNHGRGDGAYVHVEHGHNFRMTNLAAAIGLGQLDRLDEFVEARRSNATFLTEHLSDTPAITPVVPEGRDHAYHQYTIRCGNRDALRKALNERGVGSAVYYPTPIHRLNAFEWYDGPPMPASEMLAGQVLSLPVHPNLSEEDLETVAGALADALIEPVKTDPTATEVRRV